jgi:AraC family transcriptional regulator of adaptative response / DNA-3-methyladenine glycosylase II
MRALGDPDVFLPTDVGVRRALVGRGLDGTDIGRASQRWRPWRSYALMHLWASLDLGPAIRKPATTKES